jgi:hypothetical protein
MYASFRALGFVVIMRYPYRILAAVFATPRLTERGAGISDYDRKNLSISVALSMALPKPR